MPNLSVGFVAIALEVIVIKCILSAIFFLVIVASPTHSALALEVDEVEQIALLIHHTRELESAGTISAEQSATHIAKLVTQASQIAGEPLSVEKVLSWEADHALSWFSIMLYAIGGIFGLVAILGLLYFLSPLLVAIPVVAYEIVGIGAGLVVSPMAMPWNFLGASIGAASICAFVTTQAKSLKGREPTQLISLLLLLFFAYSAYFSGSSLIGAFAVASLIVLAGMSVAAGDGWFAAGFNSVSDTITSLIIGALVMTGAAVASLIPSLPSGLITFVPGGLVLGTVTLGISALVISLKDFPGNYWVNQVAAVLLILGGAIGASLVNVPYVAGILGTFGFLYLSSKLYDIFILVKTCLSSMALSMLVTGVLGAGLCWLFAWFVEKFPALTIVGIF